MVDVFDDAARRQERGLARGDEGLSRLEGIWPAIYSPWHLFSEFFPRERRGTPSVEVAEEGDDLVVRVEAPGVKPEDLNVWINDDALTVEGERREQRQVEHRGYYRSERQYGSFRRTIPLPVQVNAELANARFEHGVLEVRAPKRSPQNGRYGRRLPIH